MGCTSDMRGKPTNRRMLSDYSGPEFAIRGIPVNPLPPDDAIYGVTHFGVAYGKEKATPCKKR